MSTSPAVTLYYINIRGVTYFQRSTTVHRERRPQVSEKWRTSIPSQDITGGSEAGGAQGIGQDTYLFALDDLIQRKVTDNDLLVDQE